MNVVNVTEQYQARIDDLLGEIEKRDRKIEELSAKLEDPSIKMKAQTTQDAPISLRFELSVDEDFLADRYTALGLGREDFAGVGELLSAAGREMQALAEEHTKRISDKLREQGVIE